MADWGKIFGAAIKWLPIIIGAVHHVEDTVHAAGETKKAKAVEIAITGLQAVDAIAPAVLDHPEFQRRVGDVVDAVVSVGNAARDLSTGAKF